MNDPVGETQQAWRFPSDWGEEKRVLHELRTVSLRHGFTPERTEDMVSAVAEACLNAAEHGNLMQPDHSVTVVLTIRSGYARVCIYDEGATAEPPQPAVRRGGLLEGSPRGWGMMLMKELADELAFYRADIGLCTDMVFRQREERGHDE
jgi:serine/threonine-protein kinase RsbW